MRDKIKVGYQVYLSDGGEEFGAIRDISPAGLVVYVENAGEFVVPFGAVQSVHAQKVVFDPAQLDPRLLDAVAHAHDAEQPGL